MDSAPPCPVDPPAGRPPAPREPRGRPAASGGEGLVLRLGFRPPYDLSATLEFLRNRALPGIEHVDALHYQRVLAPAVPGGTPGWLRVCAWSGGEAALRLELHGVAPLQLQAAVGRVRRMFDLDADPRTIAAALRIDARLGALVRRRPGLRLPGGWDGFEIAVRAIVGQQISVAAARTVSARLAQRFGTALDVPLAAGLDHLFPAPAALVDADLAAVGLTRARAATVREVARAVIEGRVDFRQDRSLDDHVERWTALPGVGPWTAHYICLRALAHPDAFPADDLVLQKALPADGTRSTARALAARMEACRPWRGYAAVQLWRSASDASS